ncbi:MAG TPA: hypothetical protein VMO17_01250 [Terriglobia bacterium]|nr:hypothetical protein [Terriglobia bacterium]
MCRYRQHLLFLMACLFLAGTAVPVAHAQGSMVVIDSPPNGRIFCGPVDGATTPAAAMAVLLRNIHNTSGEKPQVGKIFRVRGTNSDAVFLTVVNHSMGDRPRAGLLIVSPSGPNQMEAGMVVDDAASFGSTMNSMLKTLFSVWHPGGSGPVSGGTAPPEKLYQTWNQDRSASLAIPAGWKVMGQGGTSMVTEPHYNAILSLNLVRLAANPSNYQPRSVGTGMNAKLIFPSNVDMARAMPSLMQEFYRLNNQRLDYRITQIVPMPGSAGQRCAHATGHGMLFAMNQPAPNVQEKDYTEMEAIVCETAPAGLTGNYFVSISTTQIDPRLADHYRATVAGILQSYQVNLAVVNREANAIAAPAINAIHQIGQQAADRYAATDRANEAQHQGYWGRQDENARTNQGFHNYILDQTVIQDNNMFGNGTVGHGTVWNSTADVLVKADPNRFEIVNNPNYWQGVDY